MHTLSYSVNVYYYWSKYTEPYMQPQICTCSTANTAVVIVVLATIQLGMFVEGQYVAIQLINDYSVAIMSE